MAKRPHDTRQWRRLRLEIIRRDGDRCTVCGATAQLEVDHIMAWERGGAWYDPANLQTVCRRCHNRKRTRGAPYRRGEPLYGKPPTENARIRTSRSW